MADRYFNYHGVEQSERSCDKLVEIVEAEIDKFKSFKKDCKDKSFYFNEKVSDLIFKTNCSKLSNMKIYN